MTEQKGTPGRNTGTGRVTRQGARPPVGLHASRGSRGPRAGLKSGPRGEQPEPNSAAEDAVDPMMPEALDVELQGDVDNGEAEPGRRGRSASAGAGALRTKRSSDQPAGGKTAGSGTRAGARRGGGTKADDVVSSDAQAGGSREHELPEFEPADLEQIVAELRDTVSRDTRTAAPIDTAPEAGTWAVGAEDAGADDAGASDAGPGDAGPGDAGLGDARTDKAPAGRDFDDDTARAGDAVAAEHYQTARAAEAEPVAEPAAAPQGEPTQDDEQLDARAGSLEARVAALKDELLRAIAETDNVRRRGERQIADAQKYAITGFANDILSVADNLHRALEAIPQDMIKQNELLGTLQAGVQAVQKDLQITFDKYGISVIEPLDTPFDPHQHQAMFEVTDSGRPAGTVVQVLQLGYMLHDRLLRPAMVGVAKGDEKTRVDTTA